MLLPYLSYHTLNCMKGSQWLKLYAVTWKNTAVVDVANLTPRAIETADWSSLPGGIDVLGVLSN